MSESIEYAHRKCETVNTKKIKQGGNIDILFIILKLLCSSFWNPRGATWTFCSSFWNCWRSVCL